MSDPSGWEKTGGIAVHLATGFHQRRVSGIVLFSACFVVLTTSWAAIADTTGRSEEAQRVLQRQTLTYRTLQALGDMKGQLQFNYRPLQFWPGAFGSAS
jgi:hypothetical protein